MSQQRSSKSDRDLFVQMLEGLSKDNLSKQHDITYLLGENLEINDLRPALKQNKVNASNRVTHRLRCRDAYTTLKFFRYLKESKKFPIPQSSLLLRIKEVSIEDPSRTNLQISAILLTY